VTSSSGNITLQSNLQPNTTRGEVDAMAARLNALLERVDRGKIKVF
jgi:hypothetical protein